MEDDLAAAVERRRDALDVRQEDLRALGELRPKFPGKIGHRIEIEDTFPIDPRRELTAAIPRCADGDGEILQLGREKTNEVEARHRLEE